MARPSSPLYYIDPFGCAKNQVDAELLMASLNAAGWRPAETAEEAALIIVNSCGFIESAKRESIEAVLAWRQRFPEKKILLAGCLAERYGAELAVSLPEADGIAGNGEVNGAASMAAALLGAASPVVRPAVPAGERPLLSLPGSAYVKIAEGCDNRCAFCAIPLIRGPLRSRPAPEIAAECRALLARGVRELCFVGQDLGSWGRDLVDGRAEGGLVSLLEEIALIPGHFWVRLLYIYPDHFPPALLDLSARDRRFLPYFDLPFQHASLGMLRAMGRRGTAAGYLELISRIRAALPGAAIRSTFLAGFPGETEADFRELLAFLDQAELEWAGAFSFSREEGTAAYGMRGRVPKKIARARVREIEDRQLPLTLRRMDMFVGRSTDVLVEEKIEGEDDLYLGRLPCQAPEVDGAAVITSEAPLLPGTIYPGKIYARAGIDLAVRVTRPEPRA